MTAKDTDAYDLTRRKVLGGMTGVGLAAAGAGLGTSAYFSDEETFKGNRLVAGELDLTVDWQQTYDGPNPETGEVEVHGVNAYPDHDGDGLQSVGGVQFGGPGAATTTDRLPAPCCQCEADEFILTYAGETHCLSPIEAERSVADYYAYQVSGDDTDSSEGAFARADTSLLFLYRNTATGDLSLVVVHDSVDSPTGGHADVRIVGFDGEPSWLVTDDGDAGHDSFTTGVGSATADWVWAGGHTDGGAVGPLSDDFGLVVRPRFDDVAADDDDPSWGGGGRITSLTVLDGDPSNAIEIATDPGGLDAPGEVSIWADCADLQSGSELDVPSVYRSDAYPDQAHLVELSDCKPGDEGEITFSLHLCDAPGYVWLTASNVEDAENGLVDPERSDPDEDGAAAGELADALMLEIWHDADCDGERGPAERLVFGPGVGGFTGADGDRPATLAAAMDVMDTNGGMLPLDGQPPSADSDAEERDCFPAESTHCVGLRWWLPSDRGNPVQTDSLSFDLGFYTEQCRANDGSGPTPDGTATGETAGPDGATDSSSPTDR